jgi:iron complex outermembrane receptor protein
VNWHFNDKTTLTAGLRDTSERKTNTSTKQALDFGGSALTDLDALGAALSASAAEIAAAKNTRSSTVGTTYATKPGQDVKGNAIGWLLSPSYNLDSDTLLYASISAGEKSGAVQFTGNGDPLNVNPEKVSDFEAGFKTVLNGKLMLNVNAYHTRVKDYQQTTSVYDDTTTLSKNDGTLYYKSVLGNIPGIVANGVEVDGAWSPASNLTLTFGTALNDAKYSDWKTATCPAELNVAKNVVCDNTNKQVVAAPKVIVTLGADYRHVLAAGYTGHAWFSNVYRTRQNFDNTLSSYGWQSAYSVTDVGFGLIGQRDKFELDLVAKNLFNTQYTTSINGAGSDRVTFDGMGALRWVGLVLRVKL